MDGKYHTLKVTLAQKQKYAIQARRGYAPKKLGRSAGDGKAGNQEALFRMRFMTSRRVSAG